MVSEDWSNYIPEDVLREIEKEERKERKREKVLLPTSRDIVNAVIAASKRAKAIHPDEFPWLVIQILKSKGFNTKYVTVKRIWRTYESLVRKGIISDTLHVVNRP